jgi:hypothetical protein
MRHCKSLVWARVCACLCLVVPAHACDGGAGVRRTGAQLMRIGLYGAGRMSVQVDAAADCEPETAGRNGRKIHTANVGLVRDGRQALARRLGFDLKIASRACLAVWRANERCTQCVPLPVERPRTMTIARGTARMRRIYDALGSIRPRHAMHLRSRAIHSTRLHAKRIPQRQRQTRLPPWPRAAARQSTRRRGCYRREG